jgi:hypothetical protein
MTADHCQLSQEVGERPRPIVFATFSGGTKACLYKVFQVGIIIDLQSLYTAVSRVLFWYFGSSEEDLQSGIALYFWFQPWVDMVSWESLIHYWPSLWDSNNQDTFLFFFPLGRTRSFLLAIDVCFGGASIGLVFDIAILLLTCLIVCVYVSDSTWELCRTGESQSMICHSSSS